MNIEAAKLNCKCLLVKAVCPTCRIVVPFAKESERGDAVAPVNFVPAVCVVICVAPVATAGDTVVIASRLFESRLKSV